MSSLNSENENDERYNALANLQPFRGVRYDTAKIGNIADVVCAPYDIIPPADQQALYVRHPKNVVRLELGLTSPDDTTADNRYTRAARTLAEWLAEGTLFREEAPALYLYEERFDIGGKSSSRLGLIGAVELAEWSERIVLPHEKTLPKPKADRLELTRATRSRLSPVFVLYNDPTGGIGRALARAMEEEPLYRFSLEEGKVAAAARNQRLWRIESKEMVEAIIQAMRDEPLYIADGHHRYETALNYWRELKDNGAEKGHPASYVMMHLVDFASPGLVVLPTHRMLKLSIQARERLKAQIAASFELRAVDGDLAELISALGEYEKVYHAFGISGLDKSENGKTRHFVIYRRRGEETARLLPQDRSDAGRALDVTVLHEMVINPLGWGEGRSGPNEEELTYTRDAREAESAIERGECDVAFYLNSTPVTAIREVADASDRMPEKSTYFWPKPVTGLVLQNWS